MYNIWWISLVDQSKMAMVENVAFEIFYFMGGVFATLFDLVSLLTKEGSAFKNRIWVKMFVRPQAELPFHPPIP
jgi:hypothetical protein